MKKFLSKHQPSIALGLIVIGAVLFFGGMAPAATAVGVSLVGVGLGLRDLKSNFNVATSLVPVVRTASANGTGVDLKGYGAAMVIFQTGAIVSAGNQTYSVEESDDDATYAEVAAADLVGSFADPAVTNTVERVSYVGSKRYIRAVVTHNSGTSVANGAVVVRGMPSAAETGL